KAAESAAFDQPRKLSKRDDTTRYRRLQHTFFQRDSENAEAARCRAASEKNRVLDGGLLVLHGAVDRLPGRLRRAGEEVRGVDATDLRVGQRHFVLRLLRGRIGGLVVEHRAVCQVGGAAIRAAIRGGVAGGGRRALLDVA